MPEPGSEAADAVAATVPTPAAARGGPVSHAIFRLARIHRMVAGQLLRRIGLHPNQELLMMQLWDTGPQSQSDLVVALDSDSATMTRMIQRLERAGFVRGSRSESDRRVDVPLQWWRTEVLANAVLPAHTEQHIATMAQLHHEIAVAVSRGRSPRGRR